MGGNQRPFLAGVIEGFYGPPWSQAERFELLGWMADWGLNTYMYAPKDDLHHRAQWRKPYSAAEAAKVGEVIRACQQRNIGFVYALGPGLDIRYHDPCELELLAERLEQMLTLGCGSFALLFDDIPDCMDSRDLQRFGSFASAQCHAVNAMFRWTRERCPKARFLFCPTPYCGRMAQRELGGRGYLATVGRELLPEIDVFWTGPEIISREITVAHARELQQALERKPLIWDNLHANDYDGRRCYVGPYSGRPPELRQEVSGLLANPNNEFPLNYVPLRTLAEFVRCGERWDARESYLSAMSAWLPRFSTIGQPVALEDLILFGDCYYLPFEEGAQAEMLFQEIRNLIAEKAHERTSQVEACRRKIQHLQALCLQMTHLRDRSIFSALSRRIWDLREEMDLIDRYLEFKYCRETAGAAFTSDFHLPSTYRGGLVARLQRLLGQQQDGSFTPAGDHRDGQNSSNP